MSDGTHATARILVVDDDALVRKLLHRVLSAQGHACVGAADAAEARQLLADPGDFELMLCDVNMPGESGLDLAKDVLGRNGDMAVVMVTALDDPDFVESALELGAYGYIIKPFKTSELLINVTNALRRGALERAARDQREHLEATVLERTAALRRRAAQQRVVAELGERALYGTELHSLFDDAMAAARTELGADLAVIFELLPDKRSLFVAACAGWDADITGASVLLDEGTDVSRALEAERGVLTGEVAAGEESFLAARRLGSAAATGGLAVNIPLNRGPFGVLALYSCEHRPIGGDDVSFVQAIANVLGHAVGRRRMEEQMHHQAMHDPLTGLPNRSLLADRLDHALARRQRRKSPLALLFIDIDHFKTINDSLGHRAGDELLMNFAERLAGLARPDDTIARFGGDEFVLLCEDLRRSESAGEIAERIRNALDEPFRLGEDTVFVTASIGIALPEPEGVSGEALIRDADAAMYRAKEHGRARYEVFDTALRRKVVERMHTETALRWAIERDELVVHYQPIVDLADHRTVGFEALVRWAHPERGLLGTAAFIPLAEESALIVAIGNVVLEKACRQLAQWIGADGDGNELWMSVNLAARQLADPGFADRVRDVVRATGIPPSRLHLEITETSLVEETVAPRDTVARLKALGVQLVLDDFGTGYSSLGYIQRFPLDAIKLDQSFIAGLAQDPTKRALVGGIVSIAHALGLATVAEGIEDRSQADAARELGCDMAQGYLFAHPADAETVSRGLRGEVGA